MVEHVRTRPRSASYTLSIRQEIDLSRFTGLILAGAMLLAAATGCATRSPASEGKPALGVSAASTAAASGASATTASLPSVEAARQPWKFAAYDGCVITTPHYRIYTTLTYEHILDRLPVFLEHAIERYTTALADLPQPKRRLESYLFHDRRQWMAKTRQILPGEAATFDQLGRGGFTTRGIAVLYYIDRGGRYRDTFAIAAHEGWHQYTQSTFRQPLPIWLEEGIATYMEGHRWGEEAPTFEPSRNWERRSALRKAIGANQLIPIDELLTEPPQTFLQQGKDRLLTYYGQVWAMVRFLEGGADGRYRAALAQLLTDAAEGRLLSRASTVPRASLRPPAGRSAINQLGPRLVQVYFNADLDAFEQDYLAHARSLAEGGAYRGRRRGRGAD